MPPAQCAFKLYIYIYIYYIYGPKALCNPRVHILTTRRRDGADEAKATTHPAGGEVTCFTCEWNLLKADLFKVRQELSNNGTRPLKPAEETKAMSEFYKKMFEANAASSEEDNESTPLSPSIRFLVCAFLCIELSSVCCERGFSIMNRIKCKARNRMYVDTLDSLMMIALNGPMDKTAKKVLIEEAYAHWASLCQRNILKSHFVPRSRKAASMPVVADDSMDAEDTANTSEPEETEERLNATEEAAEDAPEEARKSRHVECFGHLLDSDHDDDINFEPVQTELDVLQAGTTSAAAAAARRAGITQESLNAAVGCYQPPMDGPRKGWVPINPPPNFTQHELESEEGCTNLHKRKIRWIAHIFEDGWHIGRIQDDKAPKGHKHAGQYDVRYPSDGSKYWTVLHPAQYGPDQSWVYVEAPAAQQRAGARSLRSAPAKGSKVPRR